MFKQKLWKKTMSFLLTGAVLVGSISPAQVLAAVEVIPEEMTVVEDAAEIAPLSEEEERVERTALSETKELELRFDEKLEDSSGKNNPVTAYGNNHQQKAVSYVEGISGQAVSLDGSTYLDLGTSSALQPAEMTLSFWVKAPAALNGEHLIMWNKPSGNWQGTGWYLSSLDNSVPLRLSVGAQAESLTEFSVKGSSRSEFFPVGEWVNVVITYSSKSGEAKFYRNGVLCESSPSKSASKIVGNDTDHKYLGFNSPGYNGGYCKLIFDQYEIYSSIATQQEIVSAYEKLVPSLSDEEKVAADKEWLDPFAGKDMQAIKGSVVLPTEGKNGSKISWTSSNEAVIAANGKVTRPEGQDAAVTLKAVISLGEFTAEKVFQVTVVKKNTPTAENPYSAYTADQFALDEVEVTDGYYRGAQDSDVAFLKKFDVDRLLAGFRENAGLSTKGAARYNGWENGLLAGHSVGHYLSAAAQAVQSTGDVELESKLEAVIHGLKLCQDAAGTYGNSKEGFLFGANVQDAQNVELQFDIVQGDATGNTWVPWYNMHKMLQGLMDTYNYTGNEEALEVASAIGDWTYNRVSQWDAEKQKRVSWTEYGAMNGCLYELYKITHDTNHRDAAHKFDDPDLYKVIVSGDADTLKGRHANTTIPKFVGAMNRYVALKEVENIEDTVYLEYAEKFWDLVVNKHAFITGGTSDMEHFQGDGALDDIRTQCNCESCCAHNMLKLTKELFKVTGEKKYADYYESTLRNAIMGAVNENGAFSYFTPMATGYYKFFGTSEPDTNMFWCCTGTGMENYTKLGDSIYFKTADSLIVNQYIASTVIWKEKGMKLTQNSDVTASETAEFTVQLLDGKTSVNASIALRIPDWAAGAVGVKVNGQEVSYTTKGNYVMLEKDWKDGDVITYTYPMKVVAYGLDDNPSVYGFKYGPTVLAAKLGTEEWNDTTWAGANLSAPAYKVVGSEKVRLSISYGKGAKQVLGTETIAIQGNATTREFMKNINDNLVKSENSMEFCLQGTDAQEVFGEDGLTFVPFNTLNNERYGIYWYFESAEDSSEDKILAEKQEGRFAASIIDSLQPGYQQYENDAIHQMEEKDTEFATGVAGLGSTRAAKAGGSFTYNMMVDKKASNALLCQFAKEDVGKTVKITIGNTVYNYTVEDTEGEGLSYQKYFPVPDEEVAAAQTIQAGNESCEVVKVKFESASETETSARIVTGLYMTRAYGMDAELKELSTTSGRIKVSGNTYTVRVPQATERFALNFKIADSTGLLYIDGKLVNDAKAQVFRPQSGTTTCPVRVYAQDHTTYKDYTLKIIRDDGLDAGEEIIVNGDIEAGTEHWTAHDGATLSLGYSTIHGGKLSLKMSERKKTTAGAKQDITGKVKAGATYEIDGYVIFKDGYGHNTNPPANTVFNVSILYGEGESREVMLSKEVKLNQWGNLYGDYTIPEDADVSKVSILLETAYKENPSQDELVTFFVDDLSMKKLEEVEPIPGALKVGLGNGQTVAGVKNVELEVPVTMDDVTVEGCSKLEAVLAVPQKLYVDDVVFEDAAITGECSYTCKDGKLTLTAEGNNVKFTGKDNGGLFATVKLKVSNYAAEDTTVTLRAESVKAEGTDLIFDTRTTAVNVLLKYVDMGAVAKKPGYGNPLVDYKFGADPYALVYDGRVYIYMTNDSQQYEANNNGAKDNGYGDINTINVISSADMVNWTDHGSIPVAGKRNAEGAAKWANNSWAPAIAHKKIDGKDKFFLYFADNGSGIGVLTSDSPIGPFTDPIGKQLVSWGMQASEGVTWLFDPAVLVDDDGTGYLYYGGGVPDGKADNPMTVRVVKLGEDMISLDGDAKVIDAPAVFEDSGIHKYNGKYYYSYCSNFSQHSPGYPGQGNICYMTSDSPMGPFTYQGEILNNMGSFFGVGGNNHHAMFEWNGKTYITYHAQTLGKAIGNTRGYRSTHINEVFYNADGSIKPIKADYEGISQLKTVDPYMTHEAETIAWQKGITMEACSEPGQMVKELNRKVVGIEDGDWTAVADVDFGTEGAKSFKIKAAGLAGGHMDLYLDTTQGTKIGTVEIPATGEDNFGEYVCELTNAVGVHNVFMVYSGEKGEELFELDNWSFHKEAVTPSPAKPTPTPTPIPEVLADFDFDDEDSGFTSEYGKAAGKHALKDSYAASAGKALYLDGSADNFLTVTNKDGKSLLTGVKEMTVSFEMKSDRTGTANWPFYAAPNGNDQTYLQEHYIGLLENTGVLTAERYNNSGERAPANEGTASSTDWFRIDLVYTEKGTDLYVNGEKQGETVASSYKLADILGKSSIIQIGKANWTESGEYFKGWIDNYKIVSKALTAEEVKANAAAFLNAKPADKTALEKKVNAAISADKKDEYTPETWKAYEDALNAAKAVIEKADAAQTEVDEALKTLTEAQKALKKAPKPTTAPADKKALQTAVDAAAALKAADYTAESWAALQAAVKDAQAALDKADAVQADVDAAVKAVDAAVKALVKATQPKPPIKIDHTKHIGMTFYVGDLKYKITKDDGKVQEVRVTSLKNKKAAKVTIPKKATCTKLGETFKVTSIKAKAFKGTNIKKVVIGANVTKIGPNAFLNCKKLTAVTIGRNVKSIGVRAFYGCVKLQKVTVKSKVLKNVKKNAFKRISRKAVIKVPKGKKKAYARRFKGRIAKGVKIK